MEISGKNAGEVWTKALKHIFENGSEFTDRENRVCKEVLNMVLHIKDLKTITKPIEAINSFKKWVYPPLDEIEAVALLRKDIPGYYYNYGSRAFNFENSNQIDDYIIPLLKKDKLTRRATVVFYNPVKDSKLFRKDIPSKLIINFNIRDDKLHATSVIRSSDLFFGWPANIYQAFVFQKYIAKAMECEIGEITTISISAHIFEDQFDYIKEIIGK